MNTLRRAAIALLLASSALAQIAIPPHNSTYNGASRGFHFVAQTDFVITQLDLPPDAMQAGDTAGYLVRINGNVALRSVGNAGAIAANVLITTGDAVDVLGNWSPAATSISSAHNSYTSSVAPYATTIEGVPHTLYRMGWQWDIGDPNWASGSALTPGSGALGRVFVYTAPPGGSALWNTFGTACYRGSDPGVYELFDTGNAFDLMNTGLVLQSAPPTYLLLPGAATIAPPTTAPQSIGDDQTVQVALPWAFPHQGGTTNDLWVCSNGWVALEATTSTALTETVAELLSGPTRVFALWHDLDPSSAGNVYWEQDPADPTQFHVTFLGVPEYGATGPNDFQITFHQGGTIDLAWGPCYLAECMVGFAVGHGQGDPGATDLSAVTTQVLGTGILPLALDNVAGGRPVLGTTFDLAITEIPATATVGTLVYGLAAYDPGIALAGIGMAGCYQHVTPDAVAVFLPTGTAHAAQFVIPGHPSLAGMHVFAQAAVLGTPATALGVITSNGGDMLLESQ